MFNGSLNRHFVFEDFELFRKNSDSFLKFLIPLDDYWVDLGWECIFSDDGIENIYRNLLLFKSNVPMSFLVDVTNDLNILDSVSHDQSLFLMLNIILGLAADNLKVNQLRLHAHDFSDSGLDILFSAQNSNISGVLDLDSE